MATIVKAKAPTQKDKYNAIIAILSKSDNPKANDLIDFCNERIEKLAKKATSASSKKNEQDEKFFDLIADVLADGERKRANEIFNALNGEIENLSIQKITAMLKKMCESGRVEKTTEKKVTYFTLVFGESAE